MPDSEVTEGYLEAGSARARAALRASGPDARAARAALRGSRSSASQTAGSPPHR
jgi:hypothetical protein